MLNASVPDSPTNDSSKETALKATASEYKGNSDAANSQHESRRQRQSRKPSQLSSQEGLYYLNEGEEGENSFTFYGEVTKSLNRQKTNTLRSQSANSTDYMENTQE